MTTREAIRTPWPQKGVDGGKNHTLSILQWNCKSITGRVPFLLGYMQNHTRVDVLMLQSLNVQARALKKLDEYYCPPVMGTEGGRVMVATCVSTRLTYSPVDSPAGSVSCRLTTCAVRVPVKGSRRQDSNLLLLNDGSITRIGHRGQQSTAIDLTMVTPDLYHEAHWSTGVDHLQSNHLPLHLVLGE